MITLKNKAFMIGLAFLFVNCWVKEVKANKCCRTEVACHLVSATQSQPLGNLVGTFETIPFSASSQSCKLPNLQALTDLCKANVPGCIDDKDHKCIAFPAGGDIAIKNTC